jgi:hypothetical protein
LHSQACENIDWLKKQSHIRAPVDLRYESALDSRLPDGPCLLFMFCPFDERVMKDFVRRVAEQARKPARPVVTICVNPSHADLFARPGITELPLSQAARWRLRLFSPYDVRAFVFDSAAA